jgi:hypothetical protein
MSNTDDDAFDDGGADAAGEFHRLSEILFTRVAEFADDEDVDDEVIPVLLLQLAVTMRTMNYTGSVAKPSGSGLKLDLDRFRRLADDLIRETKKDADGLVTRTKVFIDAAERGELGEDGT